MKIQINITSTTEMPHVYFGGEKQSETITGDSNYRSSFYVNSKQQEEFENALENDDCVIEFQEI